MAPGRLVSLTQRNLDLEPGIVLQPRLDVLHELGAVLDLHALALSVVVKPGVQQRVRVSEGRPELVEELLELLTDAELEALFVHQVNQSQLLMLAHQRGHVLLEGLEVHVVVLVDHALGRVLQGRLLRPENRDRPADLQESEHSFLAEVV